MGEKCPAPRTRVIVPAGVDSTPLIRDADGADVRITSFHGEFSFCVGLHTCQPSRIRRDSPDFDYCVPMSRQTLQFSRQFIRRLSVRSFCPQQQVAHTGRQDTHALSVAMLTLAVEILSYAGREVRDSPPRREAPNMPA